MVPDEMCAQVSAALVELDEDRLLSGVKSALAGDVDPNEVLNRGLVAGLDEIGQQFEERVIFLPELLVAADIANKAFDLVLPHVQKKMRGQGQGKVVMGTVRGDVHDIGKNIVVSLLKATGFEVTDLGIDVDPEAFPTTATAIKADVVGLSALISSAASAMHEAIVLLRQECPGVKIIVGGAATTETAAASWGADAHARDAWAGVEKIRKLTRKVARA